MTPQMRILVAVEPVDGRKGIDSLVQLCRQRLSEDPFSGCIFVFRTRNGTSIRLLNFDGQGFWLAQKRLSKGRFPSWPQGDAPGYALEAHQAQVLLAAGNPAVAGAPIWRSVKPKQEMNLSQEVQTPMRGSTADRGVFSKQGTKEIEDRGGRHPGPRHRQNVQRQGPR